MRKKASFSLTKSRKFSRPLRGHQIFGLKRNVLKDFKEGWPSGQRQQTVNLSTYVYVGSNPTPSTKMLDRGLFGAVFFVFLEV